MDQNTTPEKQPERVFKNAYQIVVYLGQQGYKTNHYSVTKAIDENGLVKRKGGGWSQRIVDAWARRVLDPPVDESPAKNAPVIAETDGSISEQKNLAHTQKLLIEIKTKEFEFEKERGRYTLTETVAAELGARARAFRLGLERFGHEQADAVASDFGGGAKAARELVKRLGLEGEAAEQAQVLVQDFALSRAPLFTVKWMEHIELFLDPYATDQWWTQEMRAAWEKFEEGQDE